MKTIISPDINMAVDVLKNGGVIIFPTETVYGIGADSRNIKACEKIYTIKNRPKDNPFIVHLDSIESILEISVLQDKYLDSISSFSPGPITYILEKKDESIFSTGLSTIGVRIPSHPVALEILKNSKIPLSAPSANLSGKPSITRFVDSVNEFNGKVDMILDGGDCEIGIESTVIDLTTEIPVLLRPGKISFSELAKFFPKLQKYETNFNKPFEKPASPGLKYRHYAPDCEVELFRNLDEIKGNNYGVIGFDSKISGNLNKKVLSNLEYMHFLYSFFIDCDINGLGHAYCQFPIQDEYEEVLLNRIQKAIQK